MSRVKQLETRPLIGALVIYAFASLFQHIHNATFLTVYPNLPPTFSVLNVYVAWAAVTTIGVVGFLLLRYRFFAPGLLTIAIYGACGLDGLAHYIVADFSAHTRVMHASILLEVASGIVLMCLAAVTALQAKRIGLLRGERA
ncbi:MAG: hypothetical protein GX535_04890 [Xanthomonadaceae bacterium]|nr:hypothetical protein [Xanthomonadaceae bacterium]